MMEPKKRKCAIMINGGFGKELCATTLIKFIKDKYDKIITVSGYPEVFLNNPYIWRNLHMNTPYIEEDYLKDVDIIQGEPYQNLEYRKGERHLNEIFPIAYALDEYNPDIIPEIYTSPQEEKDVLNIINSAPNPVVTVQFQGGPILQNGNSIESPRNIPPKQAQLIVNKLIKAGFAVIQIKAGNQYICEGVQVFNLPLRAYMVLSKFTVGHVGIDSFMNHIAGAWKKPALIFWNQTNHKNLGYPTAININRDECPTPMCNRPRVGYGDIMPGNTVWQCPYEHRCQQWTEEEIITCMDEFIEKVKNESQAKN